MLFEYETQILYINKYYKPAHTYKSTIIFGCIGGSIAARYLIDVVKYVVIAVTLGKGSGNVGAVMRTRKTGRRSPKQAVCLGVVDIPMATGKCLTIARVFRIPLDDVVMHLRGKL